MRVAMCSRASHPAAACGLGNCVHCGVAESVADRQRKGGRTIALVHGSEAGCEDMDALGVAAAASSRPERWAREMHCGPQSR